MRHYHSHRCVTAVLHHSHSPPTQPTITAHHHSPPQAHYSPLTPPSLLLALLIAFTGFGRPGAAAGRGGGWGVVAQGQGILIARRACVPLDRCVQITSGSERVLVQWIHDAQNMHAQPPGVSIGTTTRHKLNLLLGAWPWPHKHDTQPGHLFWAMGTRTAPSLGCSCPAPRTQGRKPGKRE